MKKTKSGFPLIPVATGAILAFLTTKKKDSAAKVWAGHQPNTITTPLKNCFTEIMEEFNNVLDFSASCRKGTKQNTGKTHAAYGPASGDKQIYKGYYGIK